VDERVAAGREAWPGVEVDEARFLAWLEERGAEGLQVEELYVTCACAAGDEAAIAALEARYGGDLAAALGSFGAAVADEARQRMRASLFAPDETGRRRIADYDGRGGLYGWLRVVAVRTAISLVRATHREVPLADAVLEPIAGAGDPERDLLAATYGAEVRRSIESAVQGLSTRDRNLLRHHLLDRLTIDDLAALYGVHRATAARWLARAAERMGEATRRDLRGRLRLGAAELESVLRLVDTQLDASFSRILG
jgi:RNA polymerase sigma-70 factor (ECF subfamily)